MPADRPGGTSMGGLVSGLDSLGFGAEYLDSLVRAIDWTVMMSDKIPDSFQTYKVRRNKERFALTVPFFCVATDMLSMNEKNWTAGSLVDAMRSTMAIPGYFRPVRIEGMVLVDGGTRNNFPVDIAKAMGADIVIGSEMPTPRTWPISAASQTSSCRTSP